MITQRNLTESIARYVANQDTPQARLARWQSLPMAVRRGKIDSLRASRHVRPVGIPYGAGIAETRWALVHDPAFEAAPPEARLACRPDCLALHECDRLVSDSTTSADAERELRHGGWHVDPLGDGETIDPVGVRLAGPFRDVFAPAINYSESDCGLVVYINDATLADWFAESGESEHDADHYADECMHDELHAADAIAQRVAEVEREFHTQEAAAMVAREIREDREALREELRDLIREIRRASGLSRDGAICRALRETVGRKVRERARLLAEARKLDENPHAILCLKPERIAS